MNHSLITMSGPPSVENPGPYAFDPTTLTDLEAGLQFLAIVNERYPGITWGELVSLLRSGEPIGMDGWWTDLKKGTKSVFKGVGDVFTSSGDWVGRKLGEAVRLVTDEEVIDGAARIGTAVATSGGSEGVRGALDSVAGEEGGKLGGFLETLGGLFKSKSKDSGGSDIKSASMDLEPYVPAMVAGGVLIGVVGLFAAVGKK